MDGTGAVIWFISMTLAVFGLLAFGTFLAVNSYERARGVIHVHLWHRHG